MTLSRQRNCSTDFSEASGPLIVGIGGGASIGSSTDQALSLALTEAARHGARTVIFGGQELAQLPLYLTPAANSSPHAKSLIGAIRLANGLIIASPGYHGSVSGRVKNAIDYIEDTSKDPRPYLTDLPVGLIAVASGHQAAVSTLGALRTIAHALRAWPTPFGAAITSHAGVFRNGVCTDEVTRQHLDLVASQVSQFALRAVGSAVRRVSSTETPAHEASESDNMLTMESVC
jgi:FMN reductase